MKRIQKFLLGILLLGAACAGTQSFGDDILGDTTSAGNGWSESPWFGWVYDPYTPFYMHAQHGWVYAHRWGDWVWLWDYGVNEWFATSVDSYPMMYDVVEDDWFWYYKGTARPRWYVAMDEAELFSEFHGALLPYEMVEMLDTVMGLVSEDDPDSGDDESSLLTEAMGYALLALIGDPAEMVCPSITRTPEEVSIFALPPTVDATLDFGTGCTPEDSESVISGSLHILANNVSFTSEGISADLVINASDLTRDGMLLMNGEIIASVNVVMGEQGTTFDVDVTLNDVTSMESSVSGQLQASGTITSEEDEFGDSIMTAATVNATATNLVVDGDGPNSGTLSLVYDITTGMTLDVDVQTVLGPAELSLVMTPTANGGALLNTVGPVSLMGYSLEINDVLMEPLCETNESMPVSGTIIITTGRVEYTVVFTGDCEEGFRIYKKRVLLKAAR